MPHLSVSGLAQMIEENKHDAVFLTGFAQEVARDNGLDALSGRRRPLRRARAARAEVVAALEAVTDDSALRRRRDRILAGDFERVS